MGKLDEGPTGPLDFVRDSYDWGTGIGMQAYEDTAWTSAGPLVHTNIVTLTTLFSVARRRHSRGLC